MKNKYLQIPLALGLAFGGAQAAMADNQEHRHHMHDGRVYVTGQLGVIKYDRDRLTGSARPIYGIGIGRFFTHNFSLDLELDRNRTFFRQGVIDSSSRDYRLTGLGLTGRYHFGHGNTKPYIALGVGAQRYSHLLGNDEDWYGQLGVGLWSRLTDHINNRIELSYRYDRNREEPVTNERGFGDWRLTTHFQFMFGAPPRPPAPEPEPAEPPPPPPPPPAPEPTPEPEVIHDLDAEVFFEFDSANIRPDARSELDRVARLIREDETVRRIEVGGHTCDIGAASYNQGLSERRAQAVYDHLVGQGVSSNMLNVRGYGEDRPKVPNTSAENRRQNRRVELVVTERD